MPAKKHFKIIAIIALLAMTTTVFTGCKVSYSFSGADVDPRANTFSVDLFRVSAALANPTYAPKITERIKDQLLRQTRLNFVKSNGDIQFSGTVTNYTVLPVAITGNESAGKNRLSITVSVNYVNTFDEKKNFEKTFTRFEDFEAKENLSSVEAALIDKINDQLVQDIFNASLGNW